MFVKLNTIVNALVTNERKWGKILVTIPIVDSIGQKTWDVRNIKSGVYLYILEAGGTTKSGKLIIQ